MIFEWAYMRLSVFEGAEIFVFAPISSDQILDPVKISEGNSCGGSKMASEGAKDPWKGEEWGKSENQKKQKPSGGGAAKLVTKARKQIPRGLEEKYEAYFLPRKPWPSALAFYGSFILGGIGAGMVIEAWINKKVKEDGGVLWEFDK